MSRPSLISLGVSAILRRVSLTAAQTRPELAPALKRFSDAVRAHFGDRLERIVLYGSRARGDARPDSDYDVAIFVRELGNRWQELETIAPVTLTILAEQDELINPLLFRAGQWRHPSSPLMHEIREDGVDL